LREDIIMAKIQPLDYIGTRGIFLLRGKGSELGTKKEQNTLVICSMHYLTLHNSL
jgi:hypothetical protein